MSTVTVMKTPDGKLEHVWGVSRTWIPTEGAPCVHPYKTDEPGGYCSWHEWAAKYGKKHRSRPCSTVGCPIVEWT